MYTVLFADDSTAVRELVGGVLRSAGYSVLAAEDGAQALSLERACPGAIDLLITDVAMPRMSGIALRRAFAECRPATPVLFISGDPGNIMAGEHFLPKPFTPAQLMSTVAALLGTEHAAVANVYPVATGHNHV
jgi:CheY-like chemotaxis protein